MNRLFTCPQARTVREKLYRAFITRAGAVNEPLINKILNSNEQRLETLEYNALTRLIYVHLSTGPLRA